MGGVVAFVGQCDAGQGGHRGERGAVDGEVEDARGAEFAGGGEGADVFLVYVGTEDNAGAGEECAEHFDLGFGAGEVVHRAAEDAGVGAATGRERGLAGGDEHLAELQFHELGLRHVGGVALRI